MSYDDWKTRSPDDDTHGCEPPQCWHVCPGCDGEGVIARAITVYEPGCGFPHDDVVEDPCPTCKGACGFIDDVVPDKVERP